MQAVIVIGFRELVGDIGDLVATVTHTRAGTTCPGMGIVYQVVIPRGDGWVIELVRVVESADEADETGEIGRQGGHVGVGEEVAPQGASIVVDGDAEGVFRQRFGPTKIDDEMIGIYLRNSETLLP